MVERLMQLYRGRHADRRKAWAARSRDIEAQFNDALGEWGAFIPVLENVGEPSFLLGTTADAAGRVLPVRMALDDLAAHILVQGATNSGKSTLATWLVANALKAGRPVGVLDCKAGFFETALLWAAAVAESLPPAARREFVERLVVVNPFGDTLVPLNVCRVPPGSTAETVAYDVALILSRLWDGAMGFQMENLLRHLVLLLIEAELSLVEAPLILRDEAVRGILAERSAQPQVRDFFRRFDQIPSSSREALLTRLEALVLPENLRLMLGADTCLDFQGIFDRGQPCFLFLGMGAGIPSELTEIFGSLILQLLFAGARACRVGTRKPYLLLCDEFFHLMNVPVLAQRFERGLDTLRAFGVFLGLVMHQFGQVSGSLREAILQQCDLVALFRSTGRNAQYFGDFLPETDPAVVASALERTGRPPARHEVKLQLVEELARLPNRTCWVYDKRRPHRAIRVCVADVPEPHVVAGLSREELVARADASGIGRGGASLPKPVLREQIARRRSRLDALLRPQVAVAAPPEPSSAAPPSARRPRLG